MMSGEVYNMGKNSNRKKLESLILLYAIMVHDERIDPEVRTEYAKKYMEVVENGEKDSN